MIILLSIIASLAVIIVPIGILLAYKFGYKLGFRITKDTTKMLSKTVEENIKLKEKALVTNDIIFKLYKDTKQEIIKKAEANKMEIENLEKQALKDAFGEYGDMFKEEIGKLEENKKTQEEFKIK